MPSIRILLCCAVLLSVTHDRWLIAQGQQTASSVPTIRVTSRLVFLDVTVLYASAIARIYARACRRASFASLRRDAAGARVQDRGLAL